MKHIIIKVSICAVIFFVLAGCGKSAGNSQSEHLKTVGMEESATTGAVSGGVVTGTAILDNSQENVTVSGGSIRENSDSATAEDSVDKIPEAEDISVEKGIKKQLKWLVEHVKEWELSGEDDSEGKGDEIISKSTYYAVSDIDNDGRIELCYLTMKLAYETAEYGSQEDIFSGTYLILEELQEKKDGYERKSMGMIELVSIDEYKTIISGDEEFLPRNISIDIQKKLQKEQEEEAVVDDDTEEKLVGEEFDFEKLNWYLSPYMSPYYIATPTYEKLEKSYRYDRITAGLAE